MSLSGTELALSWRCAGAVTFSHRAAAHLAPAGNPTPTTLSCHRALLSWRQLAAPPTTLYFPLSSASLTLTAWARLGVGEGWVRGA